MLKATRYLGGLSYSAFAVAFFVFYLFVLLQDPTESYAFKNAAFVSLSITAVFVVAALCMVAYKLNLKFVKFIIIIAIALALASMFFLFFERGIRYISVIPALIRTSGRVFGGLERVRHVLKSALIAYFLGVTASYLWYRIHKSISIATNIKLFRSGGLLILLGSLLLIASAGVILCEAGYIMLAIAFFRLKF